MRNYIPKPLALAALMALALACGASQRTQTIQTAQIAVTAAAAGMVAYDKVHQEELARAGTPDEAATALKAYRAKRARFDLALVAVTDAIIVAAKLNDQPSLDGLAAALAELIRDYQDLKGARP
jgi:hypothetical protein